MARLALPFLDAVSESDEHGSPQQALIRPWKAYWPPEKGGELHRLLDQTCPEVLTWRFCSDRPFDKPWQKWSKQAILRGKNCTSQVIPPNAVHGDAINYGNDEEDGGLIVDENHCGSCQDRVIGSQTIDKIVTDLGLRAVKLAQFNYLSPSTLANSVKPFHTRLPFLGQIKRSNIVAQAYSDINVFDIHGHEDRFTLSTSGFQIVRVSKHCDHWTDESVRKLYLPAMSTWLQEFFTCRKVIIYTYTFRCADQDRTATEPWVGPYMRAHCDVTLNSGLRRLDLHVPGEAEEIRKGRFRFIGVWRPLTTPYQDRPLAMLDQRSFCQKDLIAADIVFPHYCDEGYEVLYSPYHRWFYKQQMDTDEVIMFKLYDSSLDEGRFCPHSAFVDPSVPPDTPPRASIEFRALLVD
ncbi:hypothetical protein F5Y12DRAFT_799656 [Xylaria sp. FL1777]|nr:hypothetical protein F5Y12DRAFT_799656 [Xylaria sp. FL1777]